MVLSTWEGTVQAEDLAGHWQLLMSDPKAMSCLGSIADLRACELAFSGETFRQLAQTIVQPALKGRLWKTAVVVQKPVHHGVARQFGAFTHGTTQVAIFTDEASAHAWMQL
jgi:hypothetical protein